MIRTAGIFLVRNDHHILIGHPTKHKPEVWSIPKGQVEEHENIIAAAIRETYEETNIDVSDYKVIYELEPSPYPKTKKVLHGVVLFESENPFNFHLFDIKCNSNVPLDIGGFPEMDDFKWVSLDEAEPLVHAAQVNCIQQIKELIKKKQK
jgi:8-oxo-dGTP pyrophosphatase MutT (NUDIX family)